MRNLVRAYRYGLGQIPDIYDPALQQAIDTGVVMTDAQGNPIPILNDSATVPAIAMIPPPPVTPASTTPVTSTVPTPPGFYAPITYAPQQTITPAPRVAVPVTGLSSMFSGSSSWLLIAAAAAAVLLLSAPGGRRR
jgi:hypothetical protein